MTGHTRVDEHPTITAWVSGEPVPLSDVDAREHELRVGRAGTVLPAVGTSEARQFRRWLVQVIVAERLVANEVSRRQLSTVDVPNLDDIAPDGSALLEMGSVAASLLARSAPARSVFRAVTEGVAISREVIARFHRDNPELFCRQETRTIRHAMASFPPTSVDKCPVRTVRRGELVGPLEDAVFAARPGELVGPLSDPLGWHLARVGDVKPGGVVPLAEAEPEIRVRLRAAAARRVFAHWLDTERAERVRLAPGYEHPGDPTQPDNTHRH